MWCEAFSTVRTVGLVFITEVHSGLKQGFTGSGTKSTMKKLEL